MAGWFYARDGQKKGPYSSAQLKQLADQGQLRPTDLVWKEGMPKWVPAASVKGLTTVVRPSGSAAAEPPPLPGADSANPGNQILDFWKQKAGLIGSVVSAVFLLGCCTMCVWFSSSKSGSDGDAHPGSESYGNVYPEQGLQEMLRDFDAVYDITQRRPYPMALPNQAAIAVKGSRATIYIRDGRLGSKWYKWTGKTDGLLYDPTGRSAALPHCDIVYTFDGSTVSGTRHHAFVNPWAKGEIVKMKTEFSIPINEAERVQPKN